MTTVDTQHTLDGPAVQYYILTSNPNFKSVAYWLHDHNVPLDIHLNRTRFTLDSSTKLHTEFCLRWLWACGQVDDTVDLLTGLSLVASEHC